MNMWFFRKCDNLEMPHSYNLGLAVVNYPMKSIKNRTAESVRGSTILFMVHFEFEQVSSHVVLLLDMIL